MAIDSLSWSLHPHPLPTGPGALFKLRPGSAVSICGLLRVYLSPTSIPSQLCLTMDPVILDLDLQTDF